MIMYCTLPTKTPFLPVVDTGVGSLGQLRPFAINAPLFGAQGSRNRDKKYSKITNVFRLIKRQDLRAGPYPTSYRIA